jgi:hypothetical protein
MAPKPAPFAPFDALHVLSPWTARLVAAISCLQLAAGVTVVGLAIVEPPQLTPIRIGLGASMIVNGTRYVFGFRPHNHYLTFASVACILLGMLGNILLGR